MMFIGSLSFMVGLIGSLNAVLTIGPILCSISGAMVMWSQQFDEYGYSKARPDEVQAAYPAKHTRSAGEFLEFYFLGAFGALLFMLTASAGLFCKVLLRWLWNELS